MSSRLILTLLSLLAPSVQLRAQNPSVKVLSFRADPYENQFQTGAEVKITGGTGGAAGRVEWIMERSLSIAANASWVAFTQGVGEAQADWAKFPVVTQAAPSVVLGSTPGVRTEHISMTIQVDTNGNVSAGWLSRGAGG